jgi:hypothetical protein
MLGFLRGQVGNRKLRLFGGVCCQQAGRLLRREECQQAVGVADGEATEDQLRKARRGAREVAEGLAPGRHVSRPAPRGAGLLIVCRNWGLTITGPHKGPEFKEGAGTDRSALRSP